MLRDWSGLNQAAQDVEYIPVGNVTIAPLSQLVPLRYRATICLTVSCLVFPGGGFRSASCSSNSQLTGSSSDSGSNNSDNSPGSQGLGGMEAGLGAGLENGTSSDSGSGGSSGSEQGGPLGPYGAFHTLLRPLTAFGPFSLTQRSNSCCCEEDVRRAQGSCSTLHKVRTGSLV